MANYMKAYLRVKRQTLDVDYHDLARQIWGIDRRQFTVHHYGNDDSLNNRLHLTFWLDPTEFTQAFTNTRPRWLVCPIQLTTVEPAAHLVMVRTNYLNELPMTQKAFYNLVYYLSEALGGQLSIDGQRTWVNANDLYLDKYQIMDKDFYDCLAASAQLAKTRTVIPVLHDYHLKDVG